MLLDQIICAASRGFAINDGMLKTLMAKIASDGRPGWKNGIPGPDAIHSFRARHRELAYRNQEDKYNARLKGESYYHVDTVFQVLRRLEISNPGLLQDPDRVWNMDETSIDAEWQKGESIRVLLHASWRVLQLRQFEGLRETCDGGHCGVCKRSQSSPILFISG